MAVVAAAGGHRGGRGIARGCHQSGWIFARGVWLLCRDGAGRGDGRGKMGDGDVGLRLWLTCCDFRRRPQEEGARPKSGTAAQSRHRVPALFRLFSSSPTTANTTTDQSSRPPKQTGIPTILSLWSSDLGAPARIQSPSRGATAARAAINCARARKPHPPPRVHMQTQGNVVAQKGFWMPYSTLWVLRTPSTRRRRGWPESGCLDVLSVALFSMDHGSYHLDVFPVSHTGNQSKHLLEDISPIQGDGRCQDPCFFFLSCNPRVLTLVDGHL